MSRPVLPGDHFSRSAVCKTGTKGVLRRQHNEIVFEGILTRCAEVLTLQLPTWWVNSQAWISQGAVRYAESPAVGGLKFFPNIQFSVAAEHPVGMLPRLIIIAFYKYFHC